MAVAPPQLSPDGKFYWDGTRWVPVPAQSTLSPAKASGGWGRTLVVGVVCLIVGAICGGAAASSSKPSTSTVTSTTATPSQAAASPKPSPIPRQPVAVSGQGSKVVSPFHLAGGNYKVTWSAQGHDNFIVHILLGSQTQSLVNEIPPAPASGETLFTSPQESDYTLEVKASTLTWTITFTPI